MTVIPIESSSDFHKIINKDKVVFIDFWAQWCAPCKVIKPIFEKLSNDHGGVADFYSVDVDRYDDISQEVRITHMPTFIAFKNGDVLGTVVGANMGILTVRLQISCLQVTYTILRLGVYRQNMRLLVLDRQCKFTSY
ncbi:thioredoxin-like protein [Gyrodon lividus]|nr:thioredoxin-like protein [Gyrodon lividus]